MRIQQKLLFIFIATVMTACADMYKSQPPAPVMGGYSERMPVYPNQQVPPQPLPEPPPVVQTKPLESFNKAPEMVEIKPELPPLQPYTPPPPPESPIDTATNLPRLEPPLSEVDNTVKQSAVPEFKPEEPAAPTPVEAPLVEATPAPEPPPRQVEAFAPLDSIGPQTPAVDSLVLAANESSHSGNYDSAVSSIERAIRIEPRNAGLYYKLAVLRLNQSKPRLAEDIARKAALLSAGDNKLKKHCWLLIANAREQQSNFAGADKAKAEAEKY